MGGPDALPAPLKKNATLENDLILEELDVRHNKKLYSADRTFNITISEALLA
jgi:hypothetical protein